MHQDVTRCSISYSANESILVSSLAPNCPENLFQNSDIDIQASPQPDLSIHLCTNLPIPHKHIGADILRPVFHTPA